MNFNWALAGFFAAEETPFLRCDFIAICEAASGLRFSDFGS
jgi:hypothetical protein